MQQRAKGRPTAKMGNLLLVPMVSGGMLLTTSAWAQENEVDQAPTETTSTMTLPAQSIVYSALARLQVTQHTSSFQASNTHAVA